MHEYGQLEYDDIQYTLESADAEMGAAECHGIACALACTDSPFNPHQWLARVAPDLEPDSDLQEPLLGILEQLYCSAQVQFQDPLMGFRLLLPDDEDELEQRTNALGEWCQGFLLGLAEAGVTDIEGLSGDAAEVIRDLTEVSRAGNYSADAGEGDEQAYAALVEYVRVGMLLLWEELHGADDSGQAQTLH